MVWDATCPDAFTPSHLSSAAMSSGAVAKQAEQAKRSKYAHLDVSHHFVPVAVETSGVLGPEAHHFQFLLQRVSVAVQRGNATAVLGSMKGSTDLGWEEL